LCRVVSDRFRDFVRSKRRQERCIDYSVRIENLLAREAPQPRTVDPAALAAEREGHIRLDAALRRLDAPLRRLWDARAAGQSLRTSALLLGISYHQVKRLQRQMLADLRDQLGGDND
jgi:DNA-directed RNA polymerase specialized sigma24 family protein